MLVFIFFAYPGQALIALIQDPSEIMNYLTPSGLSFILIATIVFQWMVYGLNYLIIYFEGTGLAGIGLGRIRKIDFAWAVSFWLASLVILSGLEVFMAKIGLPVDGELGYLIPKDLTGKIVWVFVSMTAGFCEEVAFRGYIMTRLRLLGKFNSWIIPVIVSAVFFGAGHIYQGFSNVIVLTIYGAMFSLLYIRTRSLWPCVIAHFLNNVFAGLVFPNF